MNKKKIIAIHLLVFIFSTLLLLFFSEPILNKFASGIHNVRMWLNLMIYGTLGIFLTTIISCLIFLHKKKNKQIKRIEFLENGFKINYEGEIMAFNWSEITILTGFKVDRITIDDICLKIETDKKESIVTEEFQGWRTFMNRLLIEFPQMEKRWEVIISKPAFERNEIELYNRSKNLE